MILGITPVLRAVFIGAEAVVAEGQGISELCYGMVVCVHNTLFLTQFFFFGKSLSAYAAETALN